MYFNYIADHRAKDSELRGKKHFSNLICSLISSEELATLYKTWSDYIMGRRELKLTVIKYRSFFTIVEV